MDKSTLAAIEAALAWGVADRPKSHDRKEIEQKAKDPAVESKVLESTGDLADVAVLRPNVYQRNGVFFVGCRQWYAPAKLKGMNMIAAAKDSMDPKIIEAMAQDMIRVHNLIHEPFAGIITAPSARHSAFIGVAHFASAIAKRMAEILELRHEVLFETVGASHKGHHPLREKDPPKLIVKNLPASKRILLIDDLATSGKTLEEHVNLLRSEGCKVSAMVWAYGSTGGTGS